MPVFCFACFCGVYSKKTKETVIREHLLPPPSHTEKKKKKRKREKKKKKVDLIESRNLLFKKSTRNF